MSEQDEIRRRIDGLGQWFHNIELKGVRTAPNHFLGDYPNVKWRRFAHAVPKDLRGMTVLDIGCNGGFYSIDNADVAVGFERVLNLLDPAVRAPAAHAGREQGRRVASSRSF